MPKLEVPKGQYKNRRKGKGCEEKGKSSQAQTTRMTVAEYIRRKGGGSDSITIGM